MTLTNADKEKVSIARYTHDEKTVIFNLLEKYEEIIDIKYRRNSSRKTMEVRECWQMILNSYNSDPRITTKRNLKQLQKFWLNAKLRKRFPTKSHRSPDQFRPKSKTTVSSSSATKTESHLQQNIQQTPSAPSESRTKYEMQIFHNPITAGVNHRRSKDMLKQESHDISIETASNDNLSINDLLEFKNANGETQILEIRRSNGNNEPSGSTTEAQDFIRNDEDDQIEKEPSEDGVYYVTTTNIINSEDDQEVEIVETPAAILGETSSRFGMSEENPENRANRKLNPVHTRQQFSERIRSIRISEAELRLKEQQMKYEKQRIELDKSREELRHMKEMHNLQLEEMRIKLKLLEESGGTKDN